MPSAEQENEAFTKTSCYHYFHSHCLASYTEHMEEEIRAQRKEKEQSLAPLLKEVMVPCMSATTSNLHLHFSPGIV